MRLKPYLKSSAKAVLHLSPLFISLFILGCEPPQIEPTYKQEDIPYHIKKICRDEYNLDVVTKTSGKTIWIYAPLNRIIHKDFGIVKDKIFDEEMSDKFRNILNTIGRVIISSDKAPEFYCLVASDITEVGLDYILIGYILDIKKSYAGFIPWTEANRRYVVKLELNPQALGDTSGEHLKTYDIDLRDFLAAQIAQRTSERFRDEGLKKYFNAKDIKGEYRYGNFMFKYSIEKVSEPEKNLDIKEEILKIIGYIIQTYEFDDFLMVEIIDELTQDKWDYSKAAVEKIK